MSWIHEQYPYNMTPQHLTKILSKYKIDLLIKWYTTCVITWVRDQQDYIIIIPTSVVHTFVQIISELITHAFLRNKYNVWLVKKDIILVFSNGTDCTNLYNI